jgi:ElaB/YqjD/DUF883 family membrane-anchored ribosome-binding protein
LEAAVFLEPSSSSSWQKCSVNKYHLNKENQNMDKHRHTASNDMGTLAEDARALMTATADVAGEKVAEARKRLHSALESAKEIAANVRDKAVAGAKATDEAMHEHPYKAIGIALGAGAIFGYILARRCSSKGD